MEWKSIAPRAIDSRWTAAAKGAPEAAPTAGSCGPARFGLEEQCHSFPVSWRMSAVKRIRKITWTRSHPYDFYLKIYIAW
jgi:hypothetical protein